MGAAVCASPSQAETDGGGGPDLKKRIKSYETEMKSPKMGGDIEVLSSMTCLGQMEVKRLRKAFLLATHSDDIDKAMMKAENLSIFWHLDVQKNKDAINRMYKAFKLCDTKSDDGFSFPHFILIIDSIIGFNYASIRLTFTRRFFGMDQIPTITTLELKKAYQSASIFASAPHFFTPLEFKDDRQKRGPNYEFAEDRRKSFNKDQLKDDPVATKRHSARLVDVNSLEVILEKRSDLWTFLMPDESLKEADFSE